MKGHLYNTMTHSTYTSLYGNKELLQSSYINAKLLSCYGNRMILLLFGANQHYTSNVLLIHSFGDHLMPGEVTV